MQEKSIIKQNILKYLDFKGISPYKFYQDSGITRGILSQNNGMSEENTTKFLAYSPDISIEWLLTGKGSMLKSEDGPIIIVQDDNQGKMLVLERDNERLKETNDLLRFKVSALEKQITEFRYNSTKEPVLYRTVAESAPELIKKEPK